MEAPLCTWREGGRKGRSERQGGREEDTFVHGEGEGVSESQLVLFEGVYKVLQHLQTKTIATVSLPDEDGVHNRKLIPLSHKAVTQTVC